MRRPETYARAVVQPQPSAFGLFLRHFEPFLPPETFDPLVIHMPSCSMKQLRDPTITVATVLRGQRHHLPDQSRLVIRYVTLAPLI
jgi:hypothetical protein